MPFPPPPKALRDQLHQLETKLLTEEANKGQNPEPPQKKTFLLDFSSTDTKDDAYDVINAEIGFNGFGRNFQAFVDILRGGFGHFDVGENIKIVVKGRQRVPKWALEILEEADNVELAYF